MLSSLVLKEMQTKRLGILQTQIDQVQCLLLKDYRRRHFICWD
jgi:hypothetical protein